MPSQEHPPGLNPMGKDDSVAVVFPARPRPDDLEHEVEALLATLAEAGLEHRIVIVGEPRGAPGALDALASRYPDRVLTVRHAGRPGSAEAERAGVLAALEWTDMRKLVLVGPGDRIDAADLPVLLRVQREERADAVVGTPERGRSRSRRTTVLSWAAWDRLLPRGRARGSACSYRLLDRWLLEEAWGRGGAAGPLPMGGLSEGALDVAGRRDVRIVELPLSRRGGHGRPPVPRAVSRSRAGLGLGTRRPAWRMPRDRVLALVTVASVVLSILACLYHVGLGSVLAYNDSGSHLLIARRVIDSPTPGLAQLGGVWPPLPHLLALPVIWHDALFYSGLAGSLISMVSYVVTVRYAYLIAAGMAGTDRARRVAAGLAAAGLFALNPNVLYLQSTPMTELLLFACIAAAVHHLAQWCRTGRYTQLSLASAATLLATLTRYEGWVLAVAMTVVVAYVSVRRWRGLARLEAHLIFFGFVAFAGIIGWVAWSWVIFGDWLYWHSGEYAKPALWVSPDDPNIGALGVAWSTYAHALVHGLGLVTPLAGAAGAIAYGWRRRLHVEAVAPYTLLIFVPFFVLALYLGQRPLHVPEVHGSFYNVRFALVMALGAAVFAGYLVSLAPLRARWAWTAATAAMVATVVAVPGTATLAEPMNWHAGRDERAVTKAVAWWRQHYDGGLVLMENHGNEIAVFDSRIPLDRIVYEGSFRLWDRALRDPAGRGIGWIYARTLPGREDKIWRALHDRPELTHDFTLVYRDAVQHIYRRRV
ncbi:unnamed protein product [[Actinomadura] parvosata subsp. kistnae]|uniref:Glycosyltransferase RgtA/B/C/D-like domain-containing protein n=1 Tax=[Actinomadura] parvosata subsp. kistnae TaxID=1909395 RepID=A0A1U9ZSS9_9ACTN|nr:hypothetical protein [Nonomuraea sp. ATCC 55076]AQZ61005.1 hypothetical protein BKM31_05465 [Nonomuraea sp. ATCC 55076]SPL91440.1 unnamed protein product [Actinomadura parvosata subsp. kistnae]